VSEIRGHVLCQVKLGEDSNESPKFNETQTFWTQMLCIQDASWNIDERLSPRMHSEMRAKLIALEMCNYP